jgi:hypothetical protein
MLFIFIIEFIEKMEGGRGKGEGRKAKGKGVQG